MLSKATSTPTYRLGEVCAVTALVGKPQFRQSGKISRRISRTVNCLNFISSRVKFCDLIRLFQNQYIINETSLVLNSISAFSAYLIRAVVFEWAF